MQTDYDRYRDVDGENDLTQSDLPRPLRQLSAILTEYKLKFGWSELHCENKNCLTRSSLYNITCQKYISL